MFRHRFDPSSVLAAILFVGIGIRYLDEGASGHVFSYAWATPSVVGAIVVIIIMRRIFRSRRREP